ncbi:MAG TPA: amidophosphoribosyltransferase [Streptosporangiaceae bacterium]
MIPGPAIPGQAGPPKEACGVFGVYAPGRSVSGLTYLGLQVLQHRGEESAGIAVGDGSAIDCHRGPGLVSQVFDRAGLEAMRGHVAIGHTRYSTSGSTAPVNAQPALDAAGRFALAHNGNLLGYARTADRLDAVVSDSHVLAAALGDSLDDHNDDLVPAAVDVFRNLRGAFSLVIMDHGRLLATRDPHGFRPLTLGTVNFGAGNFGTGAHGNGDTGWVVASETAAIEAIGGEVVRVVEPAELLIIDEFGPRSVRWAPARPKACLFEYVYLARSDSVLDGRSVYEARHQAGRALAREHPAPDADLVVGVPDSGTPSALGFAAASGLPYAQGFVRSPYVGRTFIQPFPGLRTEGLRLKLAPIGAVVRGKRVVVVDDSIVRGTTQSLLTAMLRTAGATAVHLRIASPPIRWPCFFGFDFATSDQLIAAERAVDDIRSVLGADSLGYLTLPSLIATTGQPPDHLCRACMDGCYPVTLSERGALHALPEIAETCR